MTRRSALERAALRCLPSAWRESVARDLAEERARHGHGSAWLLLQTVAIGLRLRAARLRDSVRLAGAARSGVPRRIFMRDFSRDVRLAIRGARRRPGYALAVVATLAIGIGANTAIFSVFNWIAFRPLPGVSSQQELFTIRYQTPSSDGRFFMPYLDYTTLRDEVTGFAGLAASIPLTLHLADAPGREGLRLQGEMATTNYFAVLGAAPAIGRAFLPSEERTVQTEPPAVISDSLWRRQFGGDRSALGRTIRLDGRAFVVVGIAAPGFQGRSLVTATDVWVPVGAHMALLPHYGQDALTSRRGTFFGDAFGRLRPDTSLEQAQAEALSVAEGSPEFASRGPGRPKSSIRPVLYAGLGHDTYAQARLTTTFNLLMGVVGLVLLLACANAANLLLARTAAGRREIAVRQAVGASRARIIREQMAEGLVLSLAAGTVGLALAAWLTSLFNGMRILTFLPVVEGVRVDWRVAGFALGASLLTTVVFATAPALAGSRVDLQATLKDGHTTVRRGRHALRGGLVIVQIAVSLVLLVGAGLFVRTLQNIRALDLGIEANGVFGFLVDPSRIGHEPERAQRTLQDVASRLAASPGIERAAITWSTPFGMSRAEMALARPDAPATWHEGAASAISPGYFATMGIPILAGRDFTDVEFGRLETADGVVILSRTFAERIFPGGGAVGSRLRLQYPEKMEVTVVGVVGDVRGRPITSDPEPWAYEPGGQRWPLTWAHVVVRSSLPAARVAALARETTGGVDPAFTPPLVETFEAMVDRTLAEQRLFARLSGLFAGVAALLAAIGIYAMMAGAVTERRREFGVRLALGAESSAILRLVLQGAAAIAAIGIAAGLAASAALGRVVESRLFGVAPIDPATLAVAAIAIVGLSILASVAPAIKATRTDPVRSLRAD